MESFDLLYDIGRKLSSSLDLDKVLSDILALTIPSVGATSGSIIVLDESGQARRTKRGLLFSIPEKMNAGWL
jgi:nitrate/nitrite-specific signal transduction histidine kinase